MTNNIINTKDNSYKIEESACFNSITDKVNEAALKYFGVKYLFPYQRLVIQNIIDSYNAQCSPYDSTDYNENAKQIVLLPTGSGKSLCFQLPSVFLKGSTIVIYPLNALIKDQKRRLDELNISNVELTGQTINSSNLQNTLKILHKTPDIILTNPETLSNERILKELKSIEISHIAIDEAHTVHDWGLTFRKSFLNIKDIIKELKVNIVTAFTATASPPVLKSIEDLIFGKPVHIIQGNADRPNISYSVLFSYNKELKVIELCKKEEKPLLVFCGTRKKAENMARLLDMYIQKDNVRFYHASLSPQEKKITEEWFFNSTDGILCVTCAYGMGIDKKNIRSVIHLQAGPSVESYIQEAGRSGRDGKQAKAILLWDYSDTKKYLEEKNDSPFKALGNMALNRQCRRLSLLKALNSPLEYCSGCDICNNTADFNAFDKKIVTFFIKLNPLKYNCTTITGPLKKRLNYYSLKNTGYNMWNTKEILKVLLQIKKEGIILQSPLSKRIIYNYFKLKPKKHVKHLLLLHHHQHFFQQTVQLLEEVLSSVQL